MLITLGVVTTMAKISTETHTTTQIDIDGTVHTSKLEKTHKVELSSEPDYIKLYTKMWCEFNEIPLAHRQLFIELVSRMSYCNRSSLDTSQIVYTGEPVASAICKTLNWKNKDSLVKGLRALTKCKAIKRVARGVYQINPSYAGRGEWKYNPRLDRGGVEDLIATFNFKDGTVDTKIVWADDGKDNEFNQMMRDGIGCKPNESTVISYGVKKAS